jgi:hypothetical protein
MRRLLNRLAEWWFCHKRDKHIWREVPEAVWYGYDLICERCGAKALALPVHVNCRCIPIWLGGTTNDADDWRELEPIHD